jgi:hypothetical protein
MTQCHTVDNYLVAHYDLLAPDTRAYGVSGNILTIHEAFTYMTLGTFARNESWIIGLTNRVVCRVACVSHYYAPHCRAQRLKIPIWAGSRLIVLEVHYTPP